jgi:hypothetical protein
MGVVLLLVVFLFFLLGVQGLRAFLPRVEFLKHPAPEPNEDLVNKWICQSLPFLLGTIAIAAIWCRGAC